MKKALKYILLGVVMYALFVIATLPASWLYRHGLQSRLGGWTLYAVQGSLWQGHAAVARSGDIQLEQLHWALHPLALLRGRVEVGMHFNYVENPAHLVLARSLGGNWYVNDVDLSLPAGRLSPVLRLPGAELGGRLIVRLSTLSLKQGRVTAADGKISWDKAALSKPVAVDLGSFSLDIKTTDAGIDGTLLDHGGAVQAQGLLKLNPNGQYQLTANFASRDPKQSLVTQGLQLFGTPGPDGRVKYTTSGVLPPLLPGLR